MGEVEIITEGELEERYKEGFDQIGDIEIGNLTFQPSRIVEELDPIAFRCGLNDFEDSLLSDGVMSERSHIEGEDFFFCPECNTAFDDEKEAKECCGVEK